MHFGSIEGSYKKFKFWGQSVHFWSCDITKHGFIRLAISQPFLKIETSDLDQKIL